MRKWLICFLLFPFAGICQSELDSFNVRGVELMEKREYNEASRIFGLGLAKARETKVPEGEVTFLVNLGLTAYYEGDYRDALNNYLEAQHIARQLGNDELLAYTHLNSGIVYLEQGILDRALTEALSGARLYGKWNDEDSRSGLASCYNTLGNIYQALGDHNSSISFYQKALNIWKPQGNEVDVASAVNNIGELYRAKQQPDSAIVFLNLALERKRENHDTGRLAITMAALGDAYKIKNDRLKALYYMSTAYNLRKAVRHPDLGLSCNQLAAYYLLADSGKAERFLTEGRSVLTKHGLRTDLLENYQLSRMLYKEKRDFERAWQFNEQYLALKDSLFNEDKQKTIVEMQIKYELSELQRELTLRDLEERKRSQVTILVAVVLILVCSWALSAYYRKKREKENTETLMKELNHRVKNNLQVLISLVKLQQDQLSDMTAKDAVREIESRLKAMLVIHRKLYRGKFLSIVNISEFVTELVRELTSSYGFADNKLRLDYSLENVDVPIDKAIPIALMVNEVVSNSLKYAFPNNSAPCLRISVQRMNVKGISISIKDNGPGIGSQAVRNDSFGFSLIRLLEKQLQATVKMQDENGLTTEIAVQDV